ncbi:glycerate kinase [Hydrogenophaga sp.]|uniref:glycerate kinase n=1 Tax=Hydrogenophaga sp. TaxID=1904254 RepID=UPI003D12A21D
MRFQKIFVLAGCAALLYMSHRAYGWPGLAAAGGGLLMWLLLHFTRLMTILQRAAHRPIGYVDSAVMLNAKLRPGVTLMHVVAMTRSLGERLSDENVQPEVYRWRDNGDSFVTADFQDGKLQRWKLDRPAPADADPVAPQAGGPTP